MLIYYAFGARGPFIYPTHIHINLVPIVYHVYTLLGFIVQSLEYIVTMQQSRAFS